MKENIQRVFPETIIQNAPILDKDYICYYDRQSKNYLGIKKQLITPREKVLLETFLEPVEDSAAVLNQTTGQKLWFDYLMNHSELPDKKIARQRFIHFYIDHKINKLDFLEAIHAFLQENTILVWINQDYGVIIEKESTNPLSTDDFLSLTEAFLADFYYPVDFYVGRFFDTNESLRNHYEREKLYFLTVRSITPKVHLYYFEQTFPFVIMATQGDKLLSILEDEYNELFQNDLELLTTIKMFLENNSNTSLTAKKLFLHRNSLQYRIDKFIERTSIDIKGFQGALAVYYICLYGESFSAS